MATAMMQAGFTGPKKMGLSLNILWLKNQPAILLIYRSSIKACAFFIKLTYQTKKRVTLPLVNRILWAHWPFIMMMSANGVMENTIRLVKPSTFIDRLLGMLMVIRFFVIL